MKHLTLAFAACLLVFFQQTTAQTESAVKLVTAAGNIEGSLLVPDGKTGVPVVLIIAGSGPTDRNGNQRDMENNSLKLFAEELCRNGIASLRYDKRGIAASADAAGNVSSIRFEDMVNDAKNWILLLEKDKRFNNIVIAGHSEGSLVGMMAAQKQKKVTGFISLAGAGKPADEILKEQFGAVPQNVKDIVFPLLDKIKKGDTISNVPPILYSLFNPAVQGYLISWFKYDPRKEIKKLKIPVMIVQGTTDVQVKEADAEQLRAACPAATYLVVKNMNHVLKECENTDKKYQVEEVYGNPNLPLHKDLMPGVIDFVKTRLPDKKK